MAGCFFWKPISACMATKRSYQEYLFPSVYSVCICLYLINIHMCLVHVKSFQYLVNVRSCYFMLIGSEIHPKSTWNVWFKSPSSPRGVTPAPTECCEAAVVEFCWGIHVGWVWNKSGSRVVQWCYLNKKIFIRMSCWVGLVTSIPVRKKKKKLT